MQKEIIQDMKKEKIIEKIGRLKEYSGGVLKRLFNVLWVIGCIIWAMASCVMGILLMLIAAIFNLITWPLVVPIFLLSIFSYIFSEIWLSKKYISLIEKINDWLLNIGDSEIFFWNF